MTVFRSVSLKSCNVFWHTILLISFQLLFGALSVHADMVGCLVDGVYTFTDQPCEGWKSKVIIKNTPQGSAARTVDKQLRKDPDLFERQLRNVVRYLDEGYPATAKGFAHDYGIDFDRVYAQWLKIQTERRAQEIAAQEEAATQQSIQDAQLIALEARRWARECEEAMAMATEYREEAEYHRFSTHTANRKLRERAWSRVRAAERKAEMFESICTEGAPGTAPSTLAAPATPPSVITNCDLGGCWDSLGGRYNKGAGNTYFPTTGGSCQLVGGQMQCN